MDIQQTVEMYKRTQDERDLKLLVHLLEVYASNETKKSNDTLEAKSDLNYVIFKTVEKYDLSKNIKFITYFWRAYKNHAIKQFVSSNTQKRMVKQHEISLHEHVLEDGKKFEWCFPSKTRELQRALFRSDFASVLSKIDDERDAFILEKMFHGHEQVEIARMLNLTNTAVNHRIRNLREKSYGTELYEMLKEYIAEMTIE